MRCIIAGSRTITDWKILASAIAASKFHITCVISGNACGMDLLGEEWAKNRNVPCDIYKANWYKFGKSAGPIRNSEMANASEALLLVWDGVSVGSKNMLETAKRKGLQIFEWNLGNKQQKLL